MIMGMWHGTTSVFLVYGLLMGAGASINKCWQLVMSARLGKRRYKAVGGNPLYLYACRGLTFAYFAVALTCLWVDIHGLGDILRRLGPIGCIVFPLAIAMGAAVVFCAWDFLLAWIHRSGGEIGAVGSGFMLRNASLAGRILIILVVASFFHKSPEFVYKAF
jgi:hypothetical protein